MFLEFFSHSGLFIPIVPFCRTGDLRNPLFYGLPLPDGDSLNYFQFSIHIFIYQYVYHELNIQFGNPKLTVHNDNLSLSVRPIFNKFRIMEHALVPGYFGACHYIRVHLTHHQKVAVSYIVACSRMRGNAVGVTPPLEPMA